MASVAGNGQSGLVCAGVMRVSASMPSVSVTAEASTRGCAAIARVGFSSSQSDGSDEAAPVPCSGIERQILVHCARAFCSQAGSLRIRACAAASCSSTVLSISGLICAGTLTRAPATVRLVSPRLTCAARLGSTRQVGGELRPRGDGDVAVDVGVGVEVLDVDAADLLAGLAADQADEASRPRRRLRDSEPVTFSVPVTASTATSRPGRRWP